MKTNSALRSSTDLDDLRDYLILTEASSWSTGQLPLTSLALAGTHNAGAFKAFENSDDMDELYRDCQEEDTYTQLIYGSRYLDLRPGINYINHVTGES